MDQSIVVNVNMLITILGAIVTVLLIGPIAWIVRSAVTDLRRLDDLYHDLHQQMLSNFVKKEDYRDDMAEIKSTLRQILDKVDGKADK